MRSAAPWSAGSCLERDRVLRVPEVRGSAAITPRTVLVGIVLVVVVSCASCFARYICNTSTAAGDYFPLSVAFPFLLILAVINPALHYVGRVFRGRRWAFTDQQIMVIVVMLLVGSTVPTFGLIGTWLPTITGLAWCSSAETPWLTTLLPHVNRYLMPSSIDSIRGFYLGSTEGIPWAAWVTPIIVWSGFFFAFYAFCTALVSVLTRQWIDEERISFPIAQMAVEMVRGIEGGSAIPQVFRSRLFWIGALFPAVAVSTEIIHFFFPGFAPLSLRWNIQTVVGGPVIELRFIWVIIGFTFLAKREIQFSIWFFHLLVILQLVILARLGISERVIAYHSLDPIAGWESFGAFMVYVFVALYLSRRLLARAFLKAFGRKVDLDDSGQFLPTRAAVFTMLVSFLYIVLWLRWAGMSWGVELVFLPVMLLIFVGVTRAVLETGLVWFRGPSIAQVVTTHLMGAQHMTASSVSALVMSYSIHSDIKASFMPAAAHGTYMARDRKVPMRPLAILVGVSLLVAIVSSLAYTLYLGYTYGMAGAGSWSFTGAPRHHWYLMDQFVRIKEGMPGYGPSVSAYAYTLVGVGIAIGLYLLRFRFPWWPLHPIGLAFAYTLPVRVTFLSIFIAWLVKTVILRLGGIKLYNEAKNVFLGLIFGHVIGAGVGLVIDLWMFRPGHIIYGW
ncbi:MAG: DUF6785 family protein [Planctomycetota bacterium]